MGFIDFADSRSLYLEAKAKQIGLTTGTIFPLSDIERTLSNYQNLFENHPKMGFFVFPLAFGNKENPTKKYYISRNDTTISGRLLENEEIMWAAAKDVYDFHGRKASPSKLFWRVLGLTAEYDGERDSETRTKINQQIMDLNLNLKELSRTANRLPGKWTKTHVKVGNIIRKSIGYGQSAIVPAQPSIEDYTPSKLEREAAGW